MQEEDSSLRRVVSGSWNVWLVTDVYPPNCGGSGWSTHALARVLTARGHKVEAIVVDQSSDQLVKRKFQGVSVTNLGVRSSRTLGNRLGARDYPHARVVSYLDRRLRLEPEVDIIHAQHMYSGPPSIEAGITNARATVVTVRDYWPVCLHGTSWWGASHCNGCSTGNLSQCMTEYWSWPTFVSRSMTGWARRRLRSRAEGTMAAHKVLAVSEAVRKRIESTLPGADLSVIPNIVDPEIVQSEVRPMDVGLKTSYLLTAGKLQPSKGFDLLLNALSEIKIQIPLVVAGDGPSRSSLESQAQAQGIPTKFVGWVDHGHLLSLQREAHAVLFPSAWDEPLSRVVLETMGLGTPVIAWAKGGTTEIIESGANGWLIRKSSDLDSALRELESPERREQISLASIERIRKRYSPAVIYPEIATVYAEAIKKSKCSRGES